MSVLASFFCPGHCCLVSSGWICVWVQSDSYTSGLNSCRPTGNWGLSYLEKHTPHQTPASSLEVISSTGRAADADGGEMIITAGDRLSQYKCNFLSVRFISTEAIKLLMRAWWNFLNSGTSQINGSNSFWHRTLLLFIALVHSFVYLVYFPPPQIPLW